MSFLIIFNTRWTNFLEFMSFTLMESVVELPHRISSSNVYRYNQLRFTYQELLNQFRSSYYQTIVSGPCHVGNTSSHVNTKVKLH